MNIKNSLLLLDPQFDPNTAPDCNLLIKITNDSFSYAIINQESQHLKAIFDQQECPNISQTLHSNLKNDPYLQHPFKTVKVSVATDNSIAVPPELYQQKDIPSYLNFFSKNHRKQVYIQENKDFNFTSVFGFQPEFEDSLNSTFENPVKFELTTPVLALAAGLSDGLFLDFTARSFTVIYVTGSKLIFKNSYEIEDAEEFNYYLLLILTQLNIAREETPVYISGIINEDDSRHQILQKYFKKLSFNFPQNKNVDCTILDDMPIYYYSSLLAIDLCV
ncbi:DUF3822 family protein [Pedobacter sp.]|jgi:hypothetical protein|uniref:DUF3822 family protein n=1 Tax=Pedobacter sp. TaxID=1411316 RepID=UPI002D021B7A|nr:DUF3822 family protein [Pedobacter sp.]HWW40531.1 DUF3822 family protein [Pedobacter sp.]